MKSASVYKISNKGYIIFGLSKTTNGLSIASEPYFNIPETEGNFDIVVKAIKASLSNDHEKKVPNPKDWKQFQKNLLEKIGLKSMKELETPSTKYMIVKEHNMQITFVPMRRAEKPDKGFVNTIDNESFTTEINSPIEDFFKTFTSALERCK